MRSAFLAWVAVLLLLSPPCFAQDPAASGQDIARMQALLKEAEDLQNAQLQAVLEKLSPLLAELGQLHEKGSLTAEASRLFQDALLLQIRTQVKLLAPEDDITGSFRHLLVLNPKVDESIFNPREKLLLEKIRSAETGRLSLQTDPPGGSVSYLGLDLGATPLEIPLITGNYHLHLQKQGYLDQDFDVTIRASEILTMARALRRRTVEIPLSINAAGATISSGGKALGVSQPYQTWMSSLPPDKQKDYESIVRAWDVDPASAGFFLLPEVPIGEPLSLEFSAPCHEPLAMNLQISEQEVDWSHPLVLRPELRHIQLKKDTGFMEVTSTPAGAQVWLDGVLNGKTPMQADVCVGMHRVQVLHRSGQYVREVVVRRGQVSKVTGDLKPALGFLGVYAEAPDGGPLNALSPEGGAVARKLVLGSTAFSNPQITADEIAALRKKGSLRIEGLLQPAGGAPDSADALVEEIAAASGHVDMFLFALRAGDQYLFRLYSTIHPVPDLITIPNLEDTSVDFLISQLNRAEKVGVRLQVPDLGLALLDSARGLAILKIHGQAASKTALTPGAIIKTMDQKPMTYRELQQYLRTKKPGQSVTLEVAASKATTTMVPLPVNFVGSEYPWTTPEGFNNSLLTMLRCLIERDPESDEAKYAGLSVARGLMQQGEWKLALQFLGRSNLEGHDSGICPGTVLFYQGRCYEELGDLAQAESYYNRAREYPNATLGTSDGPAVPMLTDRRMRSLKKR